MAAISLCTRESRRSSAQRHTDIHYLSTGFINGTRISFTILRRNERLLLSDALTNSERTVPDVPELWTIADYYVRDKSFHRADHGDESPGGDVGVTRIFYDNHRYAAAPEDVPELFKKIKQLMASMRAVARR